MKAQDFGQRLEAAMAVSGLPKLQFSKELLRRRGAREARGEPPLRKADRTALYSFLQGRDLPPVDTLAEMAEILGVRLGWLAEGEEPVERDLPGGAPPIWLVDGHRGPWRRPDLPSRLRARAGFEEGLGGQFQGFQEAEPTVQWVFKELLGLRLGRRRERGDRGPADPVYRGKTARGLYLKCFLDVQYDLPEGTPFSSPEFTSAFLSRVGGWMEDEGR